MREKKGVKKDFINGGLILRDASLGMTDNDGFAPESTLMQNISILENDSHNGIKGLDNVNVNYDTI
jgi:hypothetical protein